MENNLIHIKIGYDEALQSKKNLLSLELELVKTLKTIREYRTIRTNKLRLKNKLKRKISSNLTEIKKTQKLLPKIKLQPIKKETSFPRQRD